MPSNRGSSAIRVASVAEEDQQAQGRDVVVEQISVLSEKHQCRVILDMPLLALNEQNKEDCIPRRNGEM
jgi:hypothetical protein